MAFKQFHIECRHETGRVRLMVKRLAQSFCHLRDIYWLDAPQPSATLSRQIDFYAGQHDGKIVLRHRHRTAVGTVNDRNRGSPITLA